MDWANAVDFLRPYVVKLRVPFKIKKKNLEEVGTAFFIGRSSTGLHGFVTALHALKWVQALQAPIEVENSAGDCHVLSPQAGFKLTSYVIRGDTCVLAFADTGTKFFEQFKSLRPVPIRDFDTALRIGEEVGWLGFPVINSELCFFKGVVSARVREKERHYLIDGVGIGGVSGGPVFNCDSAHGVVFVGMVNAYFPDIRTVEHEEKKLKLALPGLMKSCEIGPLKDRFVQMKAAEFEHRIKGLGLEERMKEWEKSKKPKSN